MNARSTRKSKNKSKQTLQPFRRAVLRGLAILLPPLLTLVIFFWVINTVHERVLIPVKKIANDVIVWQIKDVHEENPNPPKNGEDSKPSETVKSDEEIDANKSKDSDEGATPKKKEPEEANQNNDRDGEVEGDPVYKQLSSGKYIPGDVYAVVEKELGTVGMPARADDVYRHYVDIRYLGYETVIPIFLCGFLLILYLLGKFLAAGVGRFFWISTEQIINRLPIIRNVYGSVKQVTDFVFSEREIEYTRVVAVEYPRKGMWSLGFVTGESMLDIRSAANEPVMSVLMPTSPMPATGFTITVRKSETVDLDITVEQAFQFIVSCGVVIPAQQQQETKSSIMAAISEKGIANNGASETTSLPAPQNTTSED